MALHWNIENIPNFKEDWPRDDAYCAKYQDTDVIYFFNPFITGHPIVDTIIWGSMVIGIGEITPENVDTVWQRWATYEYVIDSYLSEMVNERGSVRRELFEKLIGLKVNVSDITHTEFMQKMMIFTMERVARKVQQEGTTDNFPRFPEVGQQLPDDLFWQIVWNLREQEPKTSEAADSEYILDKLFEWRANADYEGDDRQEYASILTAVPPFKVGLGDFLEENSRFHRGGHEYDSYHHARRVAIRLKGFLVDADYVLVEDFTESED